MQTYRFPLSLLAIYFSVFAICGISPYDRQVWWAENLPIILLVISVVFLSFHYKFSNISYILMLILPILHTIGGYYTFERVPFGLITDLFDFQRNHYDRMAHFTVGFYAYPIAELILSKGLVRSRAILILFPVCVIFTVASVYELFEWWFAVVSDPSAGMAVLGSQGDIWDAQKDMLADGLGGIFSMILFVLMNNNQMKS
jgi:putative membrane protein